MFCVECGKEKSIYKDGLCIDCYLKSHIFTKGPAIIDMFVCTHCNSFKYKNTWSSDLFGDVLNRIIKNTFHISPELKKTDIYTECTEHKGGARCKVTISGFLDGIEITEEHEIEIIVRDDAKRLRTKLREVIEEKLKRKNKGK